MHFFSFFRKSGTLPRITFGITVCDEEKELEKLLVQLMTFKKTEDQILVLQDVTNPHPGVSKLLRQYEGQVVLIQSRLDGDFSTFKNLLIEQATGDYLFQIDADEFLADYLVNNIHDYLLENRRYDCFVIPRINIVRGITPSHITQWGWDQNKDGYINFPDYQMRLFKLKGGKIRWRNAVHEVLMGFKRLRKMPAENYNFCLIHDKEIQRQEKQNKFYEDNF